MPPCAFAELQDWTASFATSADARPGPLGRHRGGEAGGAAADHEHVELERRGHTRDYTSQMLIADISRLI